jgi:hypothetical protein
MTVPLPPRSMLVFGGLAALAIILASVILLELSMDFRNSAPMMLSSAARVTAVPTGHVTGPDPDQVARWAATSLARPLFAPGRRPPAQGAATKSDTPVEDPPRIAGTMVTPAGRRAIFAARGDKPLVVGEGAQVGAFTVQSIKAGQVTLLGPGGIRVLSLTFDPDAPMPPAQAPTLPGVAANVTPGAGIPVPGLPGFTLPPQPPGLANPPGQLPFQPPRPAGDPRISR